VEKFLKDKQHAHDLQVESPKLNGAMQQQVGNGRWGLD
jgi:hypothetical protein